MGYDICDDKFTPIFAACAEYALPVVIHAGMDPTSRAHVHAKPEDVAKILERFPSLRLCAAHFGDASNPDSVLRHLLRFLEQLALSEEQRQLILGENALRFLHM